MEWGRENKCTLCTLFPTSFFVFCRYLLLAIVFLPKKQSVLLHWQKRKDLNINNTWHQNNHH